MSAARTLPIRVAPNSGEALDSWLEAIARRTRTAFGDLLAAVGLELQAGIGATKWMVQLSPVEAESVSAATGIPRDRLEEMTLARYAGKAVAIDARQRVLRGVAPWGRVTGSRYCPACLEDADGRWQLTWRLGWAFACTDHRCLLVDACPHCGAVQRRRTHVGDLVPQAGRCAHPAADATGRSPARCDGILAAAAITTFDADHPVVEAQRTINAIIDCATVTSGIYRINPQPAFNVLCDIRAVAGRALAYATAGDLAAVIPRDLLNTYHAAVDHNDTSAGIARTDTKPGLAAPTRAATAAVGVIAALHALNEPDITSAAEALRWLITSSRNRGSAVTATNVGWGSNISPVLAGAQLAALSETFKPSDQLRYRIGSALPTQPTPRAPRSAGAAHHLPSMLWPAWSLPLSIPNCQHRFLRQALPIALLLVGNRLNLDDAARLVESPSGGRAASRILQLLQQHTHWTDIRAALVRMADHLARHTVPIDYQRRRQLDYTLLLPDRAWTQICRDTATPGPWVARGRIARCFLFERLSGLPANQAPFARDDNAFRTKVADFPAHLTPELARGLDNHSREFLDAHGLEQEPQVWRPPTGLLQDLELPGTHPSAVDITELHRIAADGRPGLGTVASQLGVSLDAVRYLLEVHPAPAVIPQTATNRNRAYAKAKAALPRARFIDMYHHQSMALHEIATTVGVSRQTITRLAHDYNLTLREATRRPSIAVGRDWLYDQYVNKRRPLPDIAKEVGVSTPTMARWAKKHDIPMRRRGGHRHAPGPTTESRQ